MKTLFTIVLLCISTLLWGQNYTQKYNELYDSCLLYTSQSPRDKRQSRMPSSA